jgi:hypothetical protein
MRQGASGSGFSVCSKRAFSAHMKGLTYFTTACLLDQLARSGRNCEKGLTSKQFRRKLFTMENTMKTGPFSSL